jgi:protein-L-isoaspartate(D-aspartate) O-methyltransferase
VTIDYAAQRRAMVDNQIRTYDVHDARLVAALESVPREAFVPEARRSIAYLDQPVALGAGRAMLTPMVLARLLQALEIAPGDRALDIAGGSGYTSALLSRLTSTVVMVEEDPGLAATAKAALGRIAVQNVAIVVGAHDKGAADHGPFDVIVVNGAVSNEPDMVFRQLAEGGRLGVVIGAGRSGRATIYRKSHGHISGSAVFDASAPVLAAFRPVEAFVF